LGFLNSALFESHGLLFVVRHMDVNYFAPTRLDDLCDLHTGIKEMRNTSFIMNQRLEKDGNLLFEMDVVIVGVSKAGRPVKIPEHLRKALQE
jgi:acyl-CoA thioester hydrolase